MYNGDVHQACTKRINITRLTLVPKPYLICFLETQLLCEIPE